MKLNRPLLLSTLGARYSLPPRVGSSEKVPRRLTVDESFLLIYSDLSNVPLAGTYLFPQVITHRDSRVGVRSRIRETLGVSYLRCCICEMK